MNHIIEGIGALVNPEGFTLGNRSAGGGELMSTAINPDERNQYRNKCDIPFKMICGVPKEFEHDSHSENQTCNPQEICRYCF